MMPKELCSKRAALRACLFQPARTKRLLEIAFAQNREKFPF